MFPLLIAIWYIYAVACWCKFINSFTYVAPTRLKVTKIYITIENTYHCGEFVCSNCSMLLLKGRCISWSLYTN